MKQKVLFIINPKSGTQQKWHLPELIEKHISKDLFDFNIEFTQHAKHAKTIAAQAVEDKIDLVVIAGGDGSINEVASSLIHTNVAMGIIPMGSGNGLARHLGLSLNPLKAVKKINSAKKILIDSCKINDEVFVSAAGVGFDGLVAHEFSKHKKRGVMKYILVSSQKFFGYQPKHYEVEVDGAPIKTDAFMVVVANSQQFGSGLKIAPQADLQDGLMHCCILKPFNIVAGTSLLYNGFAGKLKTNKFYELLDCKEVKIKATENSLWQKDGEPMLYNQPEVVFKINPKSLWMWV